LIGLISVLGLLVGGQEAGQVPTFFLGGRFRLLMLRAAGLIEDQQSAPLVKVSPTFTTLGP
jgi:hypothetical protein